MVDVISTTAATAPCYAMLTSVTRDPLTVTSCSAVATRKDFWRGFAVVFDGLYAERA